MDRTLRRIAGILIAFMPLPIIVGTVVQKDLRMTAQHQQLIAEPAVERQVFIVGHQVDLGAWRIIGVFDEQSVAELHCLEDSHFVGPLTVNQAIHSATELPWPDLYYPTRKDPKGL